MSTVATIYNHALLTAPGAVKRNLFMATRPEDAELLTQLGFLSTVCPHDWNEQLIQFFAGRFVNLLPHPTKDDGLLAWRAFEALYGTADFVKRIELGVSLADWLADPANGETLAARQGRLKQLAKDAPYLGDGGAQVHSPEPPRPAKRPAGQQPAGQRATGSQSTGQQVTAGLPAGGSSASEPAVASQSKFAADLDSQVHGQSDEIAVAYLTSLAAADLRQATCDAGALIAAKAQTLDPVDWLLVVKGVLFDFERKFIGGPHAAQSES